jgi:DNA-binding transcriptional LysR family regulator
MNLQDLRAFLAVARAGTLAAAGEEIHLTPSALSKALRRLESSLGVELFDRDGLRLRLNASGERFRPQAQRLADLAQAVQHDFSPASRRMDVRLTGPAVLQWGYIRAIAESIAASERQVALQIASRHESEALAAVTNGEAELALVSGEALGDAADGAVERYKLGRFRMRLVSKGRVGEPFACSTVSPLCGRVRSHQSEAWLAGAGLPPATYRVDDLGTLMKLVETGNARAFLPDLLASSMGWTAEVGSDGEWESAWLVCRQDAPTSLRLLAQQAAEASARLQGPSN